ncbi:MAG: sarcosine oxidase subunit alpha family protein [Alphaproteobacteria bacterium]|nr:sarcosine oxidase subunit alpha family protein [Alphaproteobacteria bacterium]
MTRQFWRTAAGGHGIDRGEPRSFTFNQFRLEGYAGDTIASALLANGVRLVGRSFKYHRPRGVFGIGAEEPNALLRIGTGARAEPNTRATVQELYPDLTAATQNHWPSLQFDLGALVNAAGGLFPAGFYYKTFITDPKRWLRYEAHIRRMAGLGAPPEGPDPDRYAHTNAHPDLLIAGGGPAGLAAALAAGEAGAKVILADENPVLGGQLLLAPQRVDGLPGHEWAARAEARLRALPNVRVLTRTTVAGVYEHGWFTLVERCTDHLAEPDPNAPRQRFWTVRARDAVFATGAIERPIAFADNDKPGVMLLSAVRGYLARYGVLAGRTAVLFANNDSVYATARELLAAGMRIEAVVDPRPVVSEAAAGAGAEGLHVLTGHAVTAARGWRGVRAAAVAPIGPDGRLSGASRLLTCDLIAVSGGWNPAVHLHAQSRGSLTFREDLAAFVPQSDGAPYRSAGACAGACDLAGCLRDGSAAGAAAARALGFAGTEEPPVPPAEGDPVGQQPPLWAVPARKGARCFVDFQNDVTTKDIGLARRENYASVEHLKRYTTLGMGTDQGKTSNVAGLALLAEKRGEPIPAVGTTTFRPPYTPFAFNAMAAGQWGEVGHPVRRTAAHDWHAANGAVWTDAAGWARPLYYAQEGLSAQQRIDEEALAVRHAVGLIDVSTLGKVDVQGPDAAEFLDRVYVNRFSNLKVGRGRYGVMLREDGRVYDDGVTMRLGPDHFHMTTTTNHAGGVLQLLEYLLQVVWPELRVFVTPVTEQWFAAAISGPNARALLADLAPEVDVSNAALPMMALAEGLVGGVPARIFRLSFSGEVAYEINVDADYGLALWNAILATGAAHDLKVYGTEAMATLRIEKGHFTHAEADGRVTLDDLGLGALVSGAKDCIGKRSLTLPDLVAPGRKQLVGLVAEAGERIPVGAQLGRLDDLVAVQDSQGHTTSWAYSPTLERYIALALLKDGRARHGERLYALSPVMSERAAVTVTAPCFYDPEGGRQRG